MIRAGELIITVNGMSKGLVKSLVVAADRDREFVSATLFFDDAPAETYLVESWGKEYLSLVPVHSKRAR